MLIDLPNEFLKGRVRLSRFPAQRRSTFGIFVGKVLVRSARHARGIFGSGALVGLSPS